MLGFELAAEKAVPTRVNTDGSELKWHEVGTGVQQGVALGVEWNWRMDEAERRSSILAKVRLPEHQAKKYDARLAAVQGRRKMSSGEARKISSTMDYACSATLGRRMRAFIWPLRAWEKHPGSGRRRISKEISAILPLLRVALMDRAWHPVFGKAIARRFAVLFSDARGRANGPGEPELWGTECLAAGLITATGGYYTYLLADDHAVQQWLGAVTSEHRINECEAAAALLGICSFAQHLFDVDVLHFIDSTAAEGSVIKGLSRSRTLSAIAGAYWTTANMCRAAIWVAHVPSKLNVADGPSRHDFSAVDQYGWRWVPPSLADAVPWQALLQSTAQ